MAELQSSPGRSSHAERLLERVIFGSRWLLAPFYVGLAASLVVLLVKFAQQAVGSSSTLSAQRATRSPSAFCLSSTCR